MRLLPAAAAFLLCTAVAQEPAPPPERPRLTIAATASVAPAIEKMAKAWAAPTGTEIVMVPGATHQLARQIRNGAPYDLFVSADMESVTALGAEGFAAPDTTVEWARGILVVWQDATAPKLDSWTDVARADVRRIAIANPELAPYGRAAMEALASAGIADAVRDRLVFGSDVRQALQWARTGNVDAALVSANLAKGAEGRTIPVPPDAHAPIRHGLAVVKSSPNAEAAAALARHIAASPESRAALERHGLLPPPAKETAWASD